MEGGGAVDYSATRSEFWISSYGAPLAQRNSYLAPQDPHLNGNRQWMYLSTTSINNSDMVYIVYSSIICNVILCMANFLEVRARKHFCCRTLKFAETKLASSHNYIQYCNYYLGRVLINKLGNCWVNLYFLNVLMAFQVSICIEKSNISNFGAAAVCHYWETVETDKHTQT